MNFLKVLALLIFGLAQVTADGSITGTVRLVEGGPAVGVRVVAMVVPGVGRGREGSLVLASLTQTDKDGRYQLEDIPPGRYYIAAGPLASPTFYPGTLAQIEARIVTITQGETAPSGIDFALPKAAAAPPPPISVSGPCCSGLLLTEDGSPLPVVPLRVVDTIRKLSAAVDDGFFRLFSPLGSDVQLSVQGLPPGYSLKSVVYGGRSAAQSLQIDGREPQSLLLMISVQPENLPRVTARGKVVNIAGELKGKNLSLVLMPTISTGTAVVAPLQPDHSFELPNISLGSYRAGVRPAGSDDLWAVSNVAVVRDAFSDLTIDLADNPFPELAGSALTRSIFADGKDTTITGVATQRFTGFRPLRPLSKPGYFRMHVRDERTGVLTTWAVYVENSALIPNITLGETYTVQGTAATDGTNRLRAMPF